MDISSGPLLLIFVKWPEPGCVKTRLGARIGMQNAAEVFRLMVETLAERLPKDVPLCWMFSPREKEAEVVDWLGRICSGRKGAVVFEKQAEGDLGERLERAFTWAFESGAGPVGVLGGDCLTFKPETIQEAFERCEKLKEAVIGPANDGGYWFLALPRRCDGVFRGIPWSSGSTLAATLMACRGGGMPVAETERLGDVDSLEDLAALCRADADFALRLLGALPGLARSILEDPSLPIV